jgi:hypothetical protein
MKSQRSETSANAGKTRLGLCRNLRTLLAAGAVLGASAGAVRAQAISVPNYSFESQVAPPTYPYVTTLIDSWQKAAKPAYFNETNIGLLWDQTAGLFQNTPVGATNHIDNLDGNQGLYFLAFPQVAVFQDYNTTDWNHTTPTHAFNAIYQAGLSYRLTVGVLGGLGGMPEGTGLQLGLYYRDSGNNMVPLGTTAITYTAAGFPSATHFVDFNVDVPVVQATDAWAGQNIGMELMSTSGTGQGYWDLDNVRLTEAPEPASLGLLASGLGGLLLVRRRARRWA